MAATGLKRAQAHLDAYFTKDDVAVDCVRRLPPHSGSVAFLEPSAGGGAFVRALQSVARLTHMDIAPHVEGSVRGDFLTTALDDAALWGREEALPDAIWVVGNPPFGRQSGLAKRFIKHAAESPRVALIAFVLPRSFLKPSMQKAFPPHFHCVESWDMPQDAFEVLQEDGVLKPHDVPCVFQVWERRTVPRSLPILQVPRADVYQFVSKAEAHVALRRVGVYAGKVVQGDGIESASDQSHYYIRLEDENRLEDMCRALAGMAFEAAGHTVGPKSISKQEFIGALNVWAGDA